MARRPVFDLPPRIPSATLYDMYYIATGGVMTPIPGFAAASPGARPAKQSDGSLAFADEVVGFGGQFGDGLNSITTANLQLELRAPWNATITRIVLDANASSSAVVNVTRNGTTIFGVGSTKPTLSSGTTDNKTSMTGITTAVAVGDIYVMNLDSVSGSPKRLTLTIFCTRNS